MRQVLLHVEMSDHCMFELLLYEENSKFNISLSCKKFVSYKMSDEIYYFKIVKFKNWNSCISCCFEYNFNIL